MGHKKHSQDKDRVLSGDHLGSPKSYAQGCLKEIEGMWGLPHIPPHCGGGEWSNVVIGLSLGEIT